MKKAPRMDDIASVVTRISRASPPTNKINDTHRGRIETKDPAEDPTGACPGPGFPVDKTAGSGDDNPPQRQAVGSCLSP